MFLHGPATSKKVVQGGLKVTDNFKNLVILLFLKIFLLFFRTFRTILLISISHQCTKLGEREWKEFFLVQSMINAVYHLSLIE